MVWAGNADIRWLVEKGTETFRAAYFGGRASLAMATKPKNEYTRMEIVRQDTGGVSVMVSGTLYNRKAFPGLHR
jgi:hypothetical protein